MELNFNLCGISGLPRCGSTLIAGIFNQHPDVHIEGTSGLPSLIAKNCENILDESTTTNVFLRANNRVDITNRRLVSAMINGFYYDVEKPFVIDKSRSWTIPIVLENVEKIADRKFRLLILIRPIEEIIKSFAALVDETDRTDDFYRQFFDGAAPINECFFDILKIANSNRKNVMIKEYSEIVSDPVGCIGEIRDFFGLRNFDYSFFNLNEYSPEDDSVYPYRNLHVLRNGVSRQKIEFDLPEWVNEKASEMSEMLYKFTNLSLKGETNGALC